MVCRPVSLTTRERIQSMGDCVGWRQTAGCDPKGDREVQESAALLPIYEHCVWYRLSKYPPLLLTCTHRRGMISRAHPLSTTGCPGVYVCVVRPSPTHGDVHEGVCVCGQVFSLS